MAKQPNETKKKTWPGVGQKVTHVLKRFCEISSRELLLLLFVHLYTATSLPFVLRKNIRLWRSGSRHRCSAKYVHVRCNSENFDGEASSLVEKIELRPAIFTMPAGSATAYKFSTILPFRLTLAVFSKTKPRMSAEIWFSSSTKIIRGPYNT